MEGPGGGEALLQREAKFPWRGGFFLGGPRGDSESPPLRALQTTRNPPETATVGARRPRRGATPDHPARAANIIPPIGLTVLAFIRPDFSGGASRGGGREAPSQGERIEPGGEQNLFCDPEPRPGKAEAGAANERPARGGRGGLEGPRGRYYGNLPLAPP